MKKLFSILTTVGLSLTATVSTVACATNTNNRDKDSKVDEYEKEKDLEEKQKNIIITGINDLLSDLKYETNGDETHYKSEKADLDIIISDADMKPADDKQKKYIIISNLTKTLSNENKYIASWDAVEIITEFATNKLDLPDDKYSIQRNIEPKKPNWSHDYIKYAEGIVSAEEMNKNGPPNKLLWKMGYLNKESYYVSLVDRAINAYFDGDVKQYEYNQYNPENVFLVKSGTEFNKDWINNSISNFITKDDVDFERELISRFKEIKVQAYSLPNKGKPAVPIDEVSWNSTISESQYLRFNIKFTSQYHITFYIYLKPE